MRMNLILSGVIHNGNQIHFFLTILRKKLQSGYIHFYCLLYQITNADPNNLFFCRTKNLSMIQLKTATTKTLVLSRRAQSHTHWYFISTVYAHMNWLPLRTTFYYMRSLEHRILFISVYVYEYWVAYTIHARRTHTSKHLSILAF